jgi:D-arabinonate dehydratase/D-galactarolactone cycloisomerase
VSIGSWVHFIASAHLAAAMPNTLITEYWFGENPLGDGLSEEPVKLENGFLHAPQKPGLGVKIRRDQLL